MVKAVINPDAILRYSKSITQKQRDSIPAFHCLGYLHPVYRTYSCVYRTYKHKIGSDYCIQVNVWVNIIGRSPTRQTYKDAMGTTTEMTFVYLRHVSYRGKAREALHETCNKSDLIIAISLLQFVYCEFGGYHG